MFRTLIVDSNEDPDFADDAVECSQAVAAVAKTADNGDIRAASDELARRMSRAAEKKEYDPSGPQPARRFRRACDAINE